MKLNVSDKLVGTNLSDAIEELVDRLGYRCFLLVDSDTDKLEICECPEDVDWFLGSQSELEFATIIDCTLKKSRKCATIVYKNNLFY